MDEKNRKQQIIVKICCVIAAFGLWLYINTVPNPVRTYNKNIPVTIINEQGLEQSRLALIPGQKPYVTLTLKGTINDIYSVTEDQFKVVVDLGAYVLKKGDNNIPVQIQQSPDNITILNSDNLWVKISLDDLVEKTVPLKLSTVGKPKQGYYSGKISTGVNNVSVKGPGSFVKLVDAGEVKCDIGAIYRDLNIILPIQAIDSNGNVVGEVKVYPKSIGVNVPIKKSKSVSINVKTMGKLSDNKVLDKITVEPEKVDIIGDENVINNITSLDIEPINLESLSSDEVDAKLVIPKGVTLVSNTNGFVKVKFKVQSNTILNKEVSLVVKTINMDSNYNITLDVDKVSITVSGLENVINSLKPESIECYVDLNSIKEGQHKLPVNINLPEGIKLVDKSPESITVNIKKKVTSEGTNVNQNQ
ncbi:CdaR family protein [Clostridium lundense]|uniref:CdaR family protein n=1 Tax=Clostridium lundense TaxID=319475 RepID=UPI000481D86C|nr:CdaR family protein [Clostridium lundense]